MLLQRKTVKIASPVVHTSTLMIAFLIGSSIDEEEFWEPLRNEQQIANDQEDFLLPRIDQLENNLLKHLTPKRHRTECDGDVCGLDIFKKGYRAGWADGWDLGFSAMKNAK